MRTKKVSLLKTTALFMSVVSVLISIIVVSIVYASYYFFVDQDLKTNLVSTVKQLNTDYFVYADGELQYIQLDRKVSITDLLKSRDISAVLFDDQKNRIGTFGLYRYVYDSQPDVQEMVFKSLETVSGTNEPDFSHISIVESTYETYTSPIVFNTNTIGYIQVAQQYSLIEKMKAINLWLLVLIIPPAVTIIWFIVYAVMGRFLSPFKGLVDLFSALSVDTIPQKLQTQSSFTEVNSLVEACNTMIERLKHGIQGQKHFSAYASHEINTPLTRAITDLEVLQHKNANVSLESTLNDLHEISNLLEGLLLLMQPVKREFTTHIGEVLEKIIKSNKQAMQKGISFLQPEDSSHVVKMHPAHTYILVRNLISNAVKYSPKNSQIEIKLQKKNNSLLLCVTDQGQGISEQQQKNIFEPFFRTSEAQLVTGVGLGLSLVKQICIYYNLDIVFDSKENKGTSVTISGIKLL